MRTLHVGLRVVDRERSIAFYTLLGYEVLGEVPKSDIGHLTMLKLPDDEFVALELVHQSGGARPAPGNLSHLVVQVEDVRETVQHLAAHGIKAEGPSSPTHSDDFWTAVITDPDGTRIELVQWPADHLPGMTKADLAVPDDDA